MAGRSENKRRFLALLQEEGPEAALEFFKGEKPHRLMKLCSAAIKAPDPRKKWPAVIAFGMAAVKVAAKNPEAGREILRRLVWALNDESGGVGWGAAEALGEVAARCRALAEEFFPILASYSREGMMMTDHPPLLIGAVWGLGRASRAHPDLALGQGVAHQLAAQAQSADPDLRAAAAWALGFSGAGEAARQCLAQMLPDEAEVLFFDGDGLRKTTVGQVAREAPAGIKVS